jgi:hypothetical protein
MGEKILGNYMRPNSSIVFCGAIFTGAMQIPGIDKTLSKAMGKVYA